MTVSAGDVVVLDFPGAQGIKRRPAVILSSETYHAARPDIIIGLVTSQMAAASRPTDCPLQDWKAAGLRKPSVFRSFLATLPRGAQPRAIGKLSESDWQAVQACVAKALALSAVEGGG